MNIKILYDNEAADGFHAGWGFSALVDNATLFDTGENADALLANMRSFGVSPQLVRRVILSHEDTDHVGGIAVLKECEDVNVYLPVSVPGALCNTLRILNAEVSLHLVAERTEIDSSEFVTACLGESRKEISLCLRTTKGLVLVTGCAHPGLDKIMKHVSQFGKIHAAVGGFHGFRKLRALSDVSVIVPCHCTKKKEEILDMYPDRARLGFAGMELSIGEPD